ncbi:DNA-directed primase/polymerase protein-like isoform X1 [Dreissena polymorpha]|uniref:DNA-directed primase/polymerase protein-like isoform X1 n=1 Tax=Dreissena polymorpha TaxID=45954 RepID=UPI002263F8CF|nr:DNA-directed primase/polymerase protein-like isoform X1 [Dreissena polymorpha]XP_052266751.1 DNA-directed primase/polymerase protein-like isoform X1 [Dreissena polymorpha]XP_052266752.1 DNA-directed primase/polymerase protein-like isoform X1 [Dreissena polymorpha]
MLPVSTFYGPKNKRKWIGLQNAVESKEKQFKEEKIPKPFPSRILGPSVRWETFFRQQDAINLCRSTYKDLHVFAFESDCFEGNNGQRMYLAASYPHFWHQYEQLAADKRHHYEVIPEGAVCKLYFDLEYDRVVNMGADGDTMVDTFIQVVCCALKTIFNISCTRDDVLDLDSSTEAKFSRHLIFQIKDAAFRDNIHEGKFVHYLLARILDKIHSVKPQDTISQDITSTKQYYYSGTVQDTNSNATLCSGLELSNHCSSLVSDHSDKLVGKSEIVHCQSVSVIAVDADLVKNETNSEDELICHGSDSVVLLGSEKYPELLHDFAADKLSSLLVKKKDGGTVLFCDPGVYTKNRNFRLFKSSKLHKSKPLELSSSNRYQPVEGAREMWLFYDSLIANIKYSRKLRILDFAEESEFKVSAHTCGPASKRQQSEATLDGYYKSPYPEVDEYIVSIITENDKRGVVRHWTYFHQGELLVYEIAKYRFCHNIAREHKSNNIMFIADLPRGVFYQKCHDPECCMQNYKSPEWPLPNSVLPASYFDDHEPADLDHCDLEDDLDMGNDELLKTTLELEKEYLLTTKPSMGSP